MFIFETNGVFYRSRILIHGSTKGYHKTKYFRGLKKNCRRKNASLNIAGTRWF